MKLDCCKPRWRVSPSGGGWFHELNCKQRPGGRIWLDEEQSVQAVKRKRQDHDAETASKGVATGKARILPLWAHPACYAAYWDEQHEAICKNCTYLLHDPTCDCEVCGYVGAHVDERVH